MKWSVDVVPAGLAALHHVACLATGACVADGDLAVISKNGEGTGDGTVLTGSATTHWTVHKVPGGSYELTGVSCVTGLCVAVGATSKDTDEIIFSTDGGSDWVTGAAPPGSNDGLSAVGCASKLACEAVG